MILARNIKNACESSEFRVELADLSHYAAGIKQERPIVWLLAKYFWKKGHSVDLERNNCDLVIDDATIEFKFHHDSDLLVMRRELQRFGDDVEAMWAAVKEKGLSLTWSVCPTIYKDVIVKRPNIFVWIICSRDLSQVPTSELGQICAGARQVQFNKKISYEQNRSLFAEAERFLKMLCNSRKFVFERTTLTVNSLFPSMYHIIFCDFTERVYED